MFRTAVFCFYEKNGLVGSYVDFLLNDLKSAADCLIVVVNGKINDVEKLKVYSSFLILRENKGYDVCAYKEALENEECSNIIKRSDELIFCNNSFYGPFIPFALLLKKMESSAADFWGISSVEKNLTQHIQSYFCVFRKRVIDGGEIFSYLDRHIDSEDMDYFGVCAAFENGLFADLIGAGYVYDAYKRDINYDPYRNPYGSIMGDRLPVLKRKVFSEQFFCESQAACTLQAIKKNYNYDIDMIFQDAAFTYGMDLSHIPLKADGDIVKDLIQEEDLVKREEVKKFILEHKSVYIYGAGKEAGNVFSQFFFYKDNPELKGFIISDNQERKNEVLRGYPVYHLSEVESDKNIAILVGLNKTNSMSVFENLHNVRNVKFIWKSINEKRQKR